jgi:outer membrane protein, multidrug efflux system
MPLITHVNPPAVALAMILGGCAVSSPKNRIEEGDLDFPPSWASTPEAKAGIDHNWIARFRDPQLTHLVKLAVERNPDLRQSALAIDLAISESRLARSGRLPDISATLGGFRRQQNFIGFPDFGGPGTLEQAPTANTEILSSRSNSFGVSLDVQWEIDLWGRIRSGESASIANIEASVNDFHSANSSLAAQVAKAYFALAEAVSQVEVSMAALASTRSTEGSISERFTAVGEGEGGATASQVRLAQAEAAVAETRVAADKAAAIQAHRQLERLVGQYPDGTLRALSSLPTVPPPPPPGLPSELLLRRPDVLAAERRFAAAGMRVQEARRAIYPRLALTSSGGTNSESLSNLLDSDFAVWNIGANAVQAIYAQGQIAAEKGRRDVLEQQTLAQLQSTVLNAFAEVEIALALRPLLDEQALGAARSVEFYSKALEEARSDYADGLADFLNVLTAQARLLEAQSFHLSIRRLLLDNQINLHLALGGDFLVH